MEDWLGRLILERGGTVGGGYFGGGVGAGSLSESVSFLEGGLTVAVLAKIDSLRVPFDSERDLVGVDTLTSSFEATVVVESNCREVRQSD